MQPDWKSTNISAHEVLGGGRGGGEGGGGGGLSMCLSGRDTHIMLFKVPIMLCSNSQNQANYAHCFVPIMLLISLNF